MLLRVGPGVGSIILDALRKAKKRVVVVSPWISEDLARLLVELSSKFKVTVITSRTNNPSLEVLSKRVPGRRSFVVLAVSSLLTVLSYFIYPIISPFILLLGVALFFFLAEKKPLPWVKIIDNLHAKIYVFDEKVFFSSANFTFSGLKHNTEFVIGMPLTDEIREELSKSFGIKF